MQSLSSRTNVTVRSDLTEASENGWRHIARSGTWWNSKRRLAIAAETRQATTCALCQRRKAALSPESETGAHDSLGELSETLTEVIHRVRTDSGRLSRAWFKKMLASGICDAEYVETLSIVAITTALDSLSRGLGAEPQKLPVAQIGEPSRHRPSGAKRTIAWVATLEPEDVDDTDPDPYPGKSPELVFNVHRGLSLVPVETAAFFALDDVLYLPQAAIRDFSTEPRAISHAQIELLAARVSALNQCLY